MPQPLEIGKQFLDDVLALIPEDKREEARSRYSRAQDQFQSTMTDATADLEQTRTKLEDWRRQLGTWKATSESELQRRERELAERERALGTRPATGSEPPPPADRPSATGLTKEDVAPLFDDFGRAVVGATSEVFRLSHRHAQLYPGQEFNPEVLFAHPLAKTHGLTAAFHELHKDRIAAADQAAREAHEAQIRKDEREKVQAEMRATASTLPFPTPGEDDSPFGHLARQNADNKERFGAEAASELFNQLRHQRPA